MATTGPDSASGRMRLRNAVVAAGAFVTVGIWAVAFWAWLDTDSLTAALSALKTFGSQMASVGGAPAGKGSPAPAAPQSAPMSDTAASSRDQASVAPPPSFCERRSGREGAASTDAGPNVTRQRNGRGQRQPTGVPSGIGP
jgi:hypothetical protein